MHSFTPLVSAPRAVARAVRTVVVAAALAGAGVLARPAPALAQVRPEPGRLPGTPPARADTIRADSIRSDAARRDAARADSARRGLAEGPGRRAAADTTPDPLGDLDVALQGRMESKMERARNERCARGQTFALSLGCSSGFQPTFDFQFNVKTAGSVAERLHVNVDYDSQREFDASNTISLSYEGKPTARLGRFELGNVSFAPPASRFLTAGIPSNNYGAQALGQVGRVRWRAIAAQQKGNVVNDRVFVVGARGAVQPVDRPIEDFAIEPRRFFFTVDPRTLPGWPNVDILNRPQMTRLAASLPDTLRPARLVVYRQLVGAQYQNPRGPKLSVRGARNPARQTYEVLRENVDYYVDPSLLWIALVRPLGLNNERLAVAYETTVNGARGRHVSTGGTPDVEFTEEPQYANLVWEPELAPSDPAFVRELRNVYRIGGEDVRRETVSLRIVTGAGSDQEAPPDPTFGATYLQLFGLAQANNPTTFDVENRLWPRPQDPNVNAAGTQIGAKLIRDHFVVFPSAQPFARAGLARPLANPANDTIYAFPNEFLYSAQRPQSVYRLRVRYESEGTGDASTLLLGAVQLRPGSERLTAGGRLLARGVDYAVDYELGQVTFLRAESLFPTATEVRVRFEENPLFSTQPTTVLGAAAELPTHAGSIYLTALSQRQRSMFNRAPLGLEQAGSLVAGVSAELSWNAPLVARLARRLTAPSRAAGVGGAPADAPVPARVSLRAELAASRPRASSGMQAYLESFEGEGGITLPLTEAGWYLSSAPPLGSALAGALRGQPLGPERAATLAWQSTIAAVGSREARRFPIDSIDPAVKLSGSAFGAGTEPVFWLSLFPLGIGGLPSPDATGAAAAGDPWRWRVAGAPSGRRWRSIRTVLNPGGTGVDVTAAETLEFYALVHPAGDPRVARNPTLVFDFGTVSENSVAFVPDTLVVSGAAGADSTYAGRHLAGYGRMDTERDTLSRSFNAAVNDVGLPGDRADVLTVIDRAAGGAARVERDVPLCRALTGSIRTLGDPRADCTRENSRLDEEDIDQDGQLSVDVGGEAIRRFVVDLADPATFARYARATGACTALPAGLGDVASAGDRRCWVHVRIPFRAASDSLGAFNQRRVRALRLTMVSGPQQPDDAFTRLALARLRLTGAPWLKRTERALAGIAGDSLGTVGSYVTASLVGTQDSSVTGYAPPPGVVEESSQRRTGLETDQVQVNERSLRLQAGVPGGSLRVFERAEAFFRFPEGVKNMMTYRQLRVWMRGVGGGWGPGGELNAFVKLGRDENNFYMYRTEANQGPGRDAWLPEVRVDFERFYRLRAALHEALVRGGTPGDGRYECRGVDLELVRRSGLPRGLAASRHAACDGGYMIYTVDPNVTPPNLNQVQEIAVGLVRVDSVARGGNPIVAGAPLELWVDDVRLADAEDAPGMAGELSLAVQAGDFAELRVGVTRRDPHFRQLAEAPTFVSANDVTVSASVRLDRMLPRALGLAMPLTIAHFGAGSTPLFVANSDLRGRGIGGLRTPRDAVTSYALTVRRAVPLDGGALALLLNNLSLTSTYVAGQARSTYQGTSRHAFTLRADYDLGAAAQSLLLPGGAIGGAGGADGRVRWTPTALRLTSQLARSGNRQQAFLKPVGAPDDSGKVVRGVENVWRHAALVEFHPVGAFTARWDASTLRDLRDYASPRLAGPRDTLLADAVAQERARLGGLDLGFERERAMNGVLSLAPTLPRVSRWLRPRADASTSYTMTRDPNAPSLLAPGDVAIDTVFGGVVVGGTAAGAGADARVADLVLPRRLGSTRAVSAGVNVDVGRGLLARVGADTLGHPTLRRFATVLQPMDVTVSRTLTSAFDATAADPGLGLQLGLGGIGTFRAVDGRAATAAGLVNRVTVTNALALPLGLSVASRLEIGDTRTWWRRALTNEQAEGAGVQRTLPDLTVRWNWRPAWAAAVVSGVGATAGLQRQRQTTRAPLDADADPDAVADRRTTDATSYPVSGTVTWALLGGLTTRGGLSLTRRDDALPGSRTGSTTRQESFELRRVFHPPARWNLKSDITASGGVENRRTRALVRPQPLAGGTAFDLLPAPIVQADLGRRSINFSANSDVSETLNLSLNGTRVVNFNNNLNQRFSQTVFSAVLQLNFFSGPRR